MTEKQKKQEREELAILYATLAWFYLVPPAALVLGAVLGAVITQKKCKKAK